MASQDIPTIDLTPLFSSSTLQKEKELIGEQIRSACASTGFFRIIGHGFSQEEFNELMTETHRFFSHLKTETKMKLAPKVERSYLQCDSSSFCPSLHSSHFVTFSFSFRKKWNENNKNVYRGYFPASVNGKEGLDLTNPSFDKEGFTPLLLSSCSTEEEEKKKKYIEEMEKKQRETKEKRPSRPKHLEKFEEPNPWPPTQEVSPEERFTFTFTFTFLHSQLLLLLLFILVLYLHLLHPTSLRSLSSRSSLHVRIYCLLLPLPLVLFPFLGVSL
jgi:isopenicillin N synthase-like dioxygenase